MQYSTIIITITYNTKKYVIKISYKVRIMHQDKHQELLTSKYVLSFALHSEYSIHVAELNIVCCHLPVDEMLTAAIRFDWLNSC